MRIEPEPRRIFAQEPRADGMKRAGVGRRRAPRRPRAQIAARAAAATRRLSSAAARREKVASMMRFGSAPESTRCATRCASVLVLPTPAPAMTSSGAVVLDRERCASLRSSKGAPNQGGGHGARETWMGIGGQAVGVDGDGRDADGVVGAGADRARFRRRELWGLLRTRPPRSPRAPTNRPPLRLSLCYEVLSKT